jgi:hypothetical protein
MTAVAGQASRRHLRPDDVFFFSMAVVAALVVLVGFARTYFLAGMLLAPLPSRLVHIHAVVFLSWIALFATQFHPGEDSMADVLDLYAVSVFGMLMFSVFICFAYRNRVHPAVHKRLILFATLCLLDAGFDRWSIFDPYPLWEVNLICFVPLVLATLIYDRWSTGAIQRVTIWSAAFLLATQQIRHLASQTEPWAQFAHWVGARVPLS